MGQEHAVFGTQSLEGYQFDDFIASRRRSRALMTVSSFYALSELRSLMISALLFQSLPLSQLVRPLAGRFDCSSTEGNAYVV